ncbi:LexA family protein [Patescibacteria group bacterium]
MATVTERHRRILMALREFKRNLLNNPPTTSQIARATGFHTNGVAQSLGALSQHGYVKCLGGQGGKTKWKLENQDFSHTFSITRMGIRIPDANMISLWDGFLRDVLSASMIDAEFFLGEREHMEFTGVGCPFCKKGLLKLVDVKPQYGGGMKRVPATQRHIANKYTYVCSSEDCDGEFSGEHQWEFN